MTLSCPRGTRVSRTFGARPAKRRGSHEAAHLRHRSSDERRIAGYASAARSDAIEPKYQELNDRLQSGSEIRGAGRAGDDPSRIGECAADRNFPEPRFGIVSGLPTI